MEPVYLPKGPLDRPLVRSRHAAEFKSGGSIDNHEIQAHIAIG